MITDGAFTGNVERAADACRQAGAFFSRWRKERRGVEREQMVAPSENQEGRKVRAPQGRVVRNADCPRSIDRG
jgi:hypothetical protein